MFVPEEEAGEVREENSVSDPVTENTAASAPEEDFNAILKGVKQQYQEEDREPVYTDAHYEPAGESTVPPRYYCPPERPVREPRERKERKTGGFVKALCLALVCALLGGFIGSALTAGRLSGRIDSLEARLSENETAISTVSEQQKQNLSAATVSHGESGGVTAGQIYEQACRQVVGITTDVTYTNFFGMTSSSAVSGSGFILSADGYIVTNYHVIEYAVQQKSDITVIMHDGTEYSAAIVGTEQANDIAVLKIEASNLSPVTLGDSDALHVGDTVYAVGNPLGELEFSMSTGHVSALGREISTKESESIRMFQMDAAVNPGNSGGPVYDSLGRVVGVVTAKYSESGVEGIGFAIPINDVSNITSDLITKGYVTGKAYMGVWLDERYGSMVAQYYNMPLGAYVKEVSEGSCAEKAGVQAGDVITRLGDTEVTSYGELKAAVKDYSAGDTAELVLFRAGESLTLSITFDEAKPDAA